MNIINTKVMPLVFLLGLGYIGLRESTRRHGGEV